MDAELAAHLIRVLTIRRHKAQVAASWRRIMAGEGTQADHDVVRAEYRRAIEAGELGLFKVGGP